MKVKDCMCDEVCCVKPETKVYLQNYVLMRVAYKQMI